MGVVEELKHAPFQGDDLFGDRRAALEAWGSAMLLDASAGTLSPQACQRSLQQLEDLDVHLKKAYLQEKDAAQNHLTLTWRQWSKMATTRKGASAGHKWARHPQAWQPTTTNVQGTSVRSGLPADW